MTRQSQHRKRRRILGLCEREGCEVRSGLATHCPHHAREHAEKIRRLRQALRQGAAA